MEKPTTIRIYDTLFAAALMLAAGSTLLNWNDALAILRANADTASIAPVLMIVTVVVSFGVDILIWHFISQRRSRLARRIMTVLTVVAVAWALLDPAEYAADLRADLIFWSIHALWVAQIVCLYLPASRRWFSGRSDRDVDIENTFG